MRIRMHAMVPGIAFPRETTVVGDAWIKAGISRIDIRMRSEADDASWSVPAQRDAVKYRGKVVALLAAWRLVGTLTRCARGYVRDRG